MNKKITIIIATYNAAKTLKRCLDSIVPQLTEETELILVDGDSKDSTNEIIDSYGEKITIHISEPDNGIYDAWNKGIKVAKGDWIMFFGADDILLPNAINKYLNIINNTIDIESYDYICARNEYVDVNGKLLKIIGCKPIWKVFRKTMNAAHVASLHNKKKLFDTIGGYNLNFKICADYELLMRKKNGFQSIFIDTHIARMKAGGISFSNKAIIETYRIRRLHHSLPPVINELFFLKDLAGYKFFILRKKRKIHIVINHIMTKIKGENYLLDENIPLNYIFFLVIKKMIALLYGMIRLRTFKRVFVSPSAKIICGSKIKHGSNFNVEYGCYINALSKNGLICGNNVSIGYHTYLVLSGSLHDLADSMKIGNNVGLGSHGCYGVGVGCLEIGDDTIFGNYVSIHPENHITDKLNVPIRLQGVTSKGGVKIGQNCWIGAKVTILDGTKIGNGCIVAAGAVVRGNFPDNCIIGGVPARILKLRK